MLSNTFLVSHAMPTYGKISVVDSSVSSLLLYQSPTSHKFRCIYNLLNFIIPETLQIVTSFTFLSCFKFSCHLTWHIFHQSPSTIVMISVPLTVAMFWMLRQQHPKNTKSIKYEMHKVGNTFNKSAISAERPTITNTTMPVTLCSLTTQT